MKIFKSQRCCAATTPASEPPVGQLQHDVPPYAKPRGDVLALVSVEFVVLLAIDRAQLRSAAAKSVNQRLRSPLVGFGSPEEVKLAL